MDAATSALEVLTAPPAWRRIDFISDLHLADDTPRTTAAWREYLLQTNADAVFILGDLFETWVGDDARLSAGLEADAAAGLSAAAARRPIAFMVGNRDFMLGAEMLGACSVRELADPTVLAAFGERALLTHGDAWCLADTEYLQFRRQVRDPAWQARALAMPLAQRRAFARDIRSESERKAAGHRGPWADVDVPTAITQLNAARATTLVHGHTHRPADELLAPGLTRRVLSDWHLDGLQHPRAEVLRWSADGWSRLTLADAQG